MGCQNSQLIVPIPQNQACLNEVQTKEQLNKDFAGSPKAPTNKDSVHFRQNRQQKQNKKANKMAKVLQFMNKQSIDSCQNVNKKPQVSKSASQTEIMLPSVNLQRQESPQNQVIKVDKQKPIASLRQLCEIQNVKEEQNIGPSSQSIKIPENSAEDKLAHKIDVSNTPFHSKQPKNQLFQSNSCVKDYQYKNEQEMSNESFQFEIYAQPQENILSKTQKKILEMQMQIQRQQITLFLNRIEYGQKQEVIGKIIEHLQTKEFKYEQKQCEPLMVVAIQNESTKHL